MIDFLYLAGAVAFVAAAFGYVRFCDRLTAEKGSEQ